MKNEFHKIIRQHEQRYPQMLPQDYGKLAYQSEFGPEHMVEDGEKAFLYLIKEWKEMDKVETPCRQEPIGNGLCRFHLGREGDIEETASLLAKLFVLTAKEHKGSEKGLLERLEQLRGLPVMGMEEWLSKYKEEGCPALHHSPLFRDTYHPHYRLLRAEYAFYFNVLKAIQRQAGMGKPVIVSIDGRCGSGKTGLAEVIRRVFQCNVFHMDDYYLPMDKRKENWEQIPGGNMDFERFKKEVLLPAVNGETIMYQPFDCQSGELRSPEQVQPCMLTVVEGSYCGHPLLAEEYNLKVFLTCSKDVQSLRLKEREGEYYPAFEQKWIPLEENYIQKCGIQQNSNMIVNTDEFF